ncbi:hypothetical protein Dimus_006323 [Dionaea muscipula]
MLTWGFRDDLKNLKKRLTMLQAVLDDAGTRKSLNNYLEQLWVENVKKVVQHAEDLFDEFSFENLRRKLEIKDRYYNRGAGSRLEARDLGIKAMKLTKLTVSDGSLGSVAAAGELHQYREVVDTRQVAGRDGDEAKLVE